MALVTKRGRQLSRGTRSPGSGLRRGFPCCLWGELLLAQTPGSWDPTWPALGSCRPTFPGLAGVFQLREGPGVHVPLFQVGDSTGGPCRVRSGEARAPAFPGHPQQARGGVASWHRHWVRGVGGAFSSSGPDRSCRSPPARAVGRGWGSGGGQGTPSSGPGLPVPAFPRLRSTRPTVSIAEVGAWPRVRDVGMAFGRTQTRAQAWLWGKGEVRHHCSPTLPGPGPPHLRPWTLSPHPRWPWGPPRPPSTGGWPQ